MLKFMDDDKFSDLMRLHGLGFHHPDELYSDVQHLISPIVGEMRLSEVPEDDHRLSRLVLLLELARRSAIHTYAKENGLDYAEVLEEERSFWKLYEENRRDKRLI